MALPTEDYSICLILDGFGGLLDLGLKRPYSIYVHPGHLRPSEWLDDWAGGLMPPERIRLLCSCVVFFSR